MYQGWWKKLRILIKNILKKLRILRQIPAPKDFIVQWKRDIGKKRISTDGFTLTDIHTHVVYESLTNLTVSQKAHFQKSLNLNLV